MDGKNDDKEKPRLPLFSVSQKHKGLFTGIVSIGGIFIVFATILWKWNDDLSDVFKSIFINTSVFAVFVGLLFMAPDSFADFKNGRLEKRTSRNREIAEKIRFAVEGSGRNPQSFDDGVEKQAFRLLEKHRPPRFSKIRKQKSRECNKMIAREILCAMRINLRNNLNNFDDELEKRAFRALEENRPKSLFRFFKRKKHRK